MLSFGSRFNKDTCMAGVTMNEALEQFLGIAPSQGQLSWIDECDGFACGSGCDGAGAGQPPGAKVAAPWLPPPETAPKPALRSTKAATTTPATTTVTGTLTSTTATISTTVTTTSTTVTGTTTRTTTSKTLTKTTATKTTSRTTTTPTTLTITVVTSITTTTTLKPLIAMADFKHHMLNTYKSSHEAFAALHLRPTNLWNPSAVDRTHDEAPMPLAEFIHGTETFEPPITIAEAKYAFKGLDRNSDGSLTVTEFREGIACGRFFCTDPPALTTSIQTTSMTTTSTRTSNVLHTILPQVPAAAKGKGADVLPVTMAEFKERMLKVYPSPEKAFAALRRNPSTLDEFIRLTKTFEPPLTEEQAKYAFNAIDADHNDMLASFEFLGSLAFNNFFPSHEQKKKKMGVSRESLTMHEPDSLLPETGFRRSALTIIIFATFSAVLLVLTFVTTHVLGCHRGADRLKSYTSLGARVRLAAESPREAALPAIQYGLLHQPHPSCEVQLLGGPAATCGRLVSMPSAWRVPTGRRGTTVQL